MPSHSFTPATVLLGLALAVGASASSAQDGAMKRVVNPPSLPDATQFGYSQATVAAPEALIVHIAGQVGYDPDATDNGFEAQADRAFANLSTALEASGATPADVVKITLLIVDHDESKLVLMGEKRRAMFGDALPASTLVPVTRLYAPGVLFEIDAVAAVRPSR